MGRILLVLSAGAIMVALVLALAVPAFADLTCIKEDQGENVYTEDCSGGGGSTEPPGGASDGSNVYGAGSHTTADCYGWEGGCDYSSAGGRGGRFVVDEESGEVIPGGSGGRCEDSTYDAVDEKCVGKGYTGKAA